MYCRNGSIHTEEGGGDNQTGEMYVYNGTPNPLLLSPLHRLLAHLDQTGLGFTIREVADGGNRLVGVFLGQDASLLDAIAVVDKLTSL